MSRFPALLWLSALASISCASSQDSVPEHAPTATSTAATATPSAQPTATAEPQTVVKTLFVREILIDCEGAGPQKCMHVRESADGEWELFYDAIEGFEYEEGNSYELRVEVEKVKSPPADGSSLRYVLVETVSKKNVAP